MYSNPQDVLPLPPRPSLEQYRKRAKDRIKAHKVRRFGRASRLGLVATSVHPKRAGVQQALTSEGAAE